MNTKFFFLLIATLLISTTTSSLVGSKKETHSTEFLKNKDEVNSVNIDPSQPELPLPHTLPSEEHQATKGHKPNPEDGKHHHFHFGRITTRKGRKELAIFISKIILIVAHIACFLYCFHHVFH